MPLKREGRKSVRCLALKFVSFALVTTHTIVWSHFNNSPGRNFLKINLLGLNNRKSFSSITKISTKNARKQLNTGFFYGIGEDILRQEKQEQNEEVISKMSSKSQRSESEQLYETINEFRVTAKEIRESLQDFRKELQDLSNLMKKGGDVDGNNVVGNNVVGNKLKHKNEFEAIAKDVEEWAERMISEGEEEGWREVLCNKFLRKRYNPRGNIQCFLKWMPDSRGQKSCSSEEFPCVKLFATIDAPLEDVCEYLSEPTNVPEYNDLVIQHHDIESIAPHAKICWAACPKILIINPRDFVSFCYLKWKKDGTQIVLNQAVDHPSKPANSVEENGTFCRASAFRGANIISRHPKYHDKTLLALLSHADPGGNIPRWSLKTCVNTLAPIEPFKLCHKIEKRVQASIAARKKTETVEMTSSSPSTISKRPGGLSQLGYACFWPQGGGLVENDFNEVENTEHFDDRFNQITNNDDDTHLR